MKTFKQHLLEGKQVGIIYHITTDEAIGSILQYDELKHITAISFTRNKNYSYVTGTFRANQIRLVFDGDKLSNVYKIEPHADLTSGYGSRHEREERITKTRELKKNKHAYITVRDLHKYLIAIEVYRDIDENTEQILMKYVKQYPNVKLQTKGIEKPKAYDLTDKVNSVVGYYWKNKRYTVEELLDSHPMFKDWEDIEKGAAMAGVLMPDEVMEPGVIQVTIKSVKDLEFYIFRLKEDNLTQSNIVKKKIENEIPGSKCELKIAEVWEPSGDDDE